MVTEAATERDRLLGWIELLATEIGPRRPTSVAEREAATAVAERLRGRGVAAELEAFKGYATFAAPFGVILALGLAPALLSRERGLPRALLGLLSAGALVSEGGLRWTPLSERLATRPSQNLVATIESSGPAERTVVLCCHLDTSRSGLLFHPSSAPHLHRWLQALSAASLVAAAEPLLARARAGRTVLRLARAAMGVGAGLLIERELRGVDVPGANDNASGVAVVAELATELAAEPLESTRVVVLMTGCEESGLLGAQAFLHSRDTAGWLFLNFDSVGGPGTLRFVRREGVVTHWDTDPRLLALAEDIAAQRPELGIEPAEGPIGLTYDASPVLARGGRAITFVNGDGGVIPNYHQPTDTADRVDPDAVAAALEAGREMVRAIDRGEAG